MSNPLIRPQEILLFDKTQLTHKDGFRCVSKREGTSLETLIEPSSIEYHKMTNFPIHLYRDGTDNHYCFSDKSLSQVQLNQSHHRMKKPVEITLVKSFTENECKREAQYHSDFLENISSYLKKTMKSIYNIDKSDNEPDFYKIYYLSYNFLNNTVFTLSDVADMLQIYYNNYTYRNNQDDEKDINHLLNDAQKRVNYKYGCLTNAKKESGKDLKIDIGHTYKIYMLFLLGDHYENVKEDLIPFFLGGQNTIKKYLQMISRLLNDKKNSFSSEDLNILQNLQKIVQLFQSGFQSLSPNFQKEYNSVDIQEIINFIRSTQLIYPPIISIEEEIQSPREEKKEEKKSVKDKKQKSKKQDVEQITELFNVQVDVEKYFRVHFGLIKKLYKYFEEFCRSHLLTFPYSFSMCMNYIEKDSDLLSNDDFQQMFSDSINKFNQNNYFMDRLVDVYHFFLKSYNKNNIICNLIKCDPNILVSIIQIKDYKTRIIDSNKNYKKAIESLENQCKQIYEGQLRDLFSLNILPLNFRQELQNDLKILYDHAQHLNKKNIIIFSDEDDNPEESFRNYEIRLKNQIEMIENELKTVLNKVSVMEKFIVNLQDNLSKTEDVNNIKKIQDNINKTQSRLDELKNTEEEKLNKIYQYTLLFYSAMIMRLCYYYNYLWMNNDKINLLDELQNNLQKLQKYEKLNLSQDHKHVMLYCLLQEELQSLNVEISVLLTQSFNTSTFNKAYIYQEEIENKILNENFFNTYSINDLKTHIQMFQNVIYLRELNNEYQYLINRNITLQQNISKVLPSQLVVSRKEEVNDKITNITNELNMVNTELENLKQNKENLCAYYFRQIFQGKYEDFLEQMLDQHENLNKKTKEIFELYIKYYDDSNKNPDFYYFYNDEFHVCNQTLIKNNRDSLKKTLETMITKGVFTVQQKNQIEFLIFSLLSGVFISYFYYKCKLQILQKVPNVSINFENVKQLSVINELNILTGKMKQTYMELFISRYIFKKADNSTSYIASSLLK